MFSDDDLDRLITEMQRDNFDFTELLLPQQMQALLARLEAAEAVIHSLFIIKAVFNAVFMWPNNLDNGPRIALEAWRKASGLTGDSDSIGAGK